MATGQMMVGLVARLRRSAPQAGILAKDYAREVARAGAQHRLRDCGELDYASCACAQNYPALFPRGRRSTRLARATCSCGLRIWLNGYGANDGWSGSPAKAQRAASRDSGEGLCQRGSPGRCAAPPPGLWRAGLRQLRLRPEYTAGVFRRQQRLQRFQRRAQAIGIAVGQVQVADFTSRTHLFIVPVQMHQR